MKKEEKKELEELINIVLFDLEDVENFSVYHHDVYADNLFVIREMLELIKDRL